MHTGEITATARSYGRECPRDRAVPTNPDPARQPDPLRLPRRGARMAEPAAPCTGEAIQPGAIRAPSKRDTRGEEGRPVRSPLVHRPPRPRRGGHSLMATQY